MTHPRRLLLVLTENQTIVDPRDLDGLVQIAVDAEAAGVDGVMMSEHIVLGPSAGAEGVMLNERDYAAPGNQDPATPWPSSVVMLSAIAQATTTLRLVAGAVIAPLRHPLLLARELGTLDLLSHGRLVVLPTVSWHRDEYEALGVPFGERGKILDEQLEVWARAWGTSPFCGDGPRFAFDDVWMEPGPARPGGPALWFGGQGMHPPLIRRIVRHGSGVNPFGPLTDDDLAALRNAMADAGRDFAELELVGGIRGTFHAADDVADLDDALSRLPRQLEQGFTTICFKPAMFVRTADEVGDLCRELVARLDAM
jgi:alkanesulfonate monooxygenase SsuD/methylene tetrahydromethanopterin reductase-like flavin-dependent oxidoreductase (luciferase family)